MVATMNKYNAIRTTVDGVDFDSKREAGRYRELKLAVMSGAIADLELHPKFPLEVNGKLICTYEADFRYHDNERGEDVVEDAKGVRTPVYKLKKKLVLAIYGIEIMEV